MVSSCAQSSLVLQAYARRAGLFRDKERPELAILYASLNWTATTGEDHDERRASAPSIGCGEDMTSVNDGTVIAWTPGLLISALP